LKIFSSPNRVAAISHSARKRLRVVFLFLLTLRITADSSTLPATLAVSTNDSGIILHLSGGAGAVYEVQASSDLKLWAPIGLCTLPPDGNMSFREPAPAPERRCYRAVLADSMTPDSFLVMPGDGLSAEIGGGTLTTADGSIVQVPGGSIVLQPNTTNYVALDLFDLQFRVLPRFIHSGGALLAEVVTGANAVIGFIQHTVHSIPPTRIPRFKRKLANSEPARALILGDSLSVVYGVAPSNSWPQLVAGANPSTNRWNLLSVDPNLTYVDIANGGATARYGMAVIGATIPPNDLANPCDNQDQAFFRTAYNDASAPEAPTARRSPFLENPPDMLLISFGANTTVDEVPFLETTVRAFRQAGSEVVIMSDNDWLDPTHATPLTDDPNRLTTIADAQGCAIADTLAFVGEANREGTYTYIDAVHQDPEGERQYAAACRSVLNDLAQLEEIRLPSPLRATLGASEVPPYRFPNSTLLQFRPNATTGSRIAAQDDRRNMAVSLGGQQASNAVVLLRLGQYAAYSCSRVLGVDAIVENQTGENGILSVSIDSGASQLKQINIYGVSLGIAWTQVPLLTAAEVWQLNHPGYITNWNELAATLGLRLTCVAGAIKLAGVVFYTIKGADIPFESMAFAGQWGAETSALDSPPWRYTGVAGNFAVIPFVGNGIEVLLHAGSAAGTILSAVDVGGILVQSSFSLQRASGATPLVYSMKVFPGSLDLANPITDGYGPHVLVLQLDGYGPSPAPSTQGNRPFAIYSAQALDAR
jgi:hypothetical protein